MANKDAAGGAATLPLQPAQVAAQPSVDMDSTPPSTMVWRSVQEGGDTKTKKSRRTLAMPWRCVDALKLHRERQDVAKKAARDRWQDNDLVFASKVGTELDAHNVRRSFRAVLKRPAPPRRTGHRARCGTASSHCSPTQACPSRPYTGSNSDP